MRLLNPYLHKALTDKVLGCNRKIFQKNQYYVVQGTKINIYICNTLFNVWEGIVLKIVLCFCNAASTTETDDMISTEKNDNRNNRNRL